MTRATSAEFSPSMGCQTRRTSTTDGGAADPQDSISRTWLSQRSYDLHLDGYYQPRWLRPGEPRPVMSHAPITPLAAAPSRCPPGRRSRAASQTGRCSAPAPAPGSATPSSSTGSEPDATGRPCTLLRPPRNPLIMPAFPPLTRLPPAASPAWAATMCFHLFRRGEPHAWLKRQYGMRVQYLVMTTPATHKERFR